MACTNFSLRTDGLTGADPGGTWTLVSGSYSGSLAGDNPSIDWDDLGFGANVFEYCIPGCDGNPDCEQVTLYKMDIGTVSGGTTLDLCEGDDAENLSTVLTIAVGPDGVGTWSGDTANAGWSEPLFDPGLSGPGTFTFTYTIDPDVPPSSTDLACCDPVSATIIVNVSAGASAGTGGSFSGCP